LAGLQSSMSVLVPLAILVTGVALWLAARTFVADTAKVSRAAAAHGVESAVPARRKHA